jgi:N-acetyl-1-D-myo-inositol-2-amino-2-deoxy-alpha-D-glucopyranoside deacetylase
MTAAASVLAVFAHPDDEVLCGAGTLALCGLRQRPVTLVCATRGEHGPISDPALATRETLPQVREAELRASCAALGIGDLRWLGLPDGDVSWSAEERGTLDELVQMIRSLRPRVLLTFGPDGLYGHTDHVAIGELVVEARRMAADPAVTHGGAVFAVPRLFFAVMTERHVRELSSAVSEDSGRAARLWDLNPEAFYASESAITASVDVSSVVNRKLAAIQSHRTQLEADNALRLITPELAARYLSVEHFHCADGLEGDPLSA